MAGANATQKGHYVLFPPVFFKFLCFLRMDSPLRFILRALWARPPLCLSLGLLGLDFSAIRLRRAERSPFRFVLDIRI